MALTGVPGTPCRENSSVAASRMRSRWPGWPAGRPGLRLGGLGEAGLRGMAAGSAEGGVQLILIFALINSRAVTTWARARPSAVEMCFLGDLGGAASNVAAALGARRYRLARAGEGRKPAR
ncbi:protein of unknown function [Cupriavidus taiwanensis]|uniref:Uncharacterized protein n=1 Tax=Cupriavidus taiwanensis TaxID=164546 RepID=A0A9Q7XQF8_9BURK|nr:protein of unknown function [Cupriavidus taiwanensis]